MTERRPADLPVGNWVDQLVRQAQERGEFDNLPGAGKPLPDVDGPHDENWWIRRKLADEGLPADALLPPALQLRKEVAALPETVRDLPSEDAVRETVREVNQRVAAWIRTPSGPVVPVGPADVETVVRGWRAGRTAAAAGATPSQPDGGTSPAPPDGATSPARPDGGENATGKTRPPWWRRVLRRRAHRD
ncbi:DnaJ family domain-containing protein [Georgenia subflava]|uniref:DUF1992 domain-containing protein n=1 Tax=Georgenia subflava TaxID=1622177 RepID=A0A6N7ENN8_9MICO|nr:DUF1992 domain-containing protein [Georgenia subflava]MPV38487.1 DUF1992 domain-containing protein [Georgenia subflava]